MQPSLPVTTPETKATKPVQSAADGDGYWRSIGELEQSPEFEQFMHREFPQAASEFPEGTSRRRWMKLMSASLALGGLAGCRYGPNEIAAMVNRPANRVPGVPKMYATNFELAGRAVQLLVSNVDGRPIKIEGNPDHPLMLATEPNDLSGGKGKFKSAGTDVFSQACILGLYDPDRTAKVMARSEGELEESSWEAFAEYATSKLVELSEKQGESLAILMSPSLSPSVNRMVAETVKAMPKTTVCQYSSIDTSAQEAACTAAAGKPAELLIDLQSAKVICCLDSDLLGNDPNMLLHSRNFSKHRDPDPKTMNRLYAVESRFSVTGSAADSRLSVRSSQIGAFLTKLTKAVEELLAGGSAMEAAEDREGIDDLSLNEQVDLFVAAMASDLVANKGTSVVSVGAHLPVDVQVAALQLNEKLENIGKTVKLMPSRTAIEGVTTVGLKGLAGKLGNDISTVWIVGDNPVYAAPADIGLGDKTLGGLLSELDDVVYFSEYTDETSKVASWNLPLAHALESWGDVLSVDGTYGICQPQILPLLNGKSAVEIFSLLHGQQVEGQELVKATAGTLAGGSLSSRDWREALHNGFLADSSTEPIEGAKFEGELPTGAVEIEEFDNGELELQFVVSDALYDGRFAKNVWLQELPQALTRLTWDNAALVSPITAKKLGLKQGHLARVIHDGKEIKLPVFIMPGQAPGTIVAHLGYGRICRDEAVDSDKEVPVGVDLAPLRSLDSMNVLTNVEIRSSSRPYKLATTQDHFAIDETGQWGIEQRVGRLVREGSIEQVAVYDHHEGYIKGLGIHHPDSGSLWEEPIDKIEANNEAEFQWAMAVDLNKCTGCNSCVIACQSENNIPVVGKEQVSNGREMHWIRVDRYFRGSEAAPKIVNQPVACAHCETAPCEQVCPVAATVHTEEGINAMAYNRCIGTRYCANNCPYKVRRFNYFNYQTEYGYFYGWQQRGKLEEASRKLQSLVLNPEVSVRGRGVMEKCTYCVQRVQNGKISARNEGRKLSDGDVQTACQTACPTQAIVFGDLVDTNSKVSKSRHDSRNYAMLEELNIEPRTQYLARVRNTHPLLNTADQLKKPEAHGHGHGHDSHGDVKSHGEDDHAEGHGEAEHAADDHGGEKEADH